MISPDSILRFVSSRGGALLYEVIEELGAEGNFLLSLAGHPNVVLWAGVSEEFVAAFNGAWDKLEVRRANPAMFACFSDNLGFPQLPVVSAPDWADKKLDYDHKRWLPVVLFPKEAKTA